jgi:hypothetical protein
MGIKTQCIIMVILTIGGWLLGEKAVMIIPLAFVVGHFCGWQEGK